MEELKRRNFSQGVQDDPSWFRYILGCLECETGDLTAGLDRCESALRGEEELLAQEKGPWKGKPQLCRLTSSRSAKPSPDSAFLARRSSREERLAQQRQILAERKALHEREPKVRQYERELGASAAVLSGLLLETGHADEALAVVEDVLPALEKLVHDDKPDSSQPSQVDSRNYFIRQVLGRTPGPQGRSSRQNRQGHGCQPGHPPGHRDHRGSLQAGTLLPRRPCPPPDPCLDLARQRGRRPCRGPGDQSPSRLHRLRVRQSLQAQSRRPPRLPPRPGRFPGDGAGTGGEGEGEGR